MIKIIAFVSKHGVFVTRPLFAHILNMQWIYNVLKYEKEVRWSEENTITRKTKKHTRTVANLHMVRRHLQFTCILLQKFSLTRWQLVCGAVTLVDYHQIKWKRSDKILELKNKEKMYRPSEKTSFARKVPNRGRKVTILENVPTSRVFSQRKKF